MRAEIQINESIVRFITSFMELNVRGNRINFAFAELKASINLITKHKVAFKDNYSDVNIEELSKEVLLEEVDLMMVARNKYFVLLGELHKWAFE